jgi:hypothetical protein
MSKHTVERTLFSALQELGKVFGEDRVMNAAGQVLQTAAQTKAAVDDNMATLLSLANLPSRSDIETLRRQLDVMQTTLANLSRKVDRLIEETTQKAAPKTRRVRTGPHGTHLRTTPGGHEPGSN